MSRLHEAEQAHRSLLLNILKLLGEAKREQRRLTTWEYQQLAEWFIGIVDLDDDATSAALDVLERDRDLAAARSERSMP